MTQTEITPLSEAGKGNFDPLLQQLTTEEKIKFLAGANFWETAAVERLGIPSLKVSDGPNGARGEAFLDGTTAACFPACVSIAATFNKSLAYRIGKALGQETQTKGAYVLLGPTVCCHRSPLGGRNFEAFSEDPVVSGLMASQYVKGLQSERIAATLKHYIGNEQDTKRFSLNEIISERAQREIYLRPFELVVKQAQPWCIMTSYPSINGVHVESSKRLLTDILREEWKYDGLIMSDWGATHTPIDSVNAGLDLEMPGPARFRTISAVETALKKNGTTLSTLNARVERTLQLLQRTGKFTDRKTTPVELSIDLPEHRALIREAGAEGIVLLKNKDNILPIKKDKCKKIALIGPLADYAAAHGGGSASLNCHYKISPLQAMQERFGGEMEISVAKGANILRIYPALELNTTNHLSSPGWTASYFKNPSFTGAPFIQKTFPRGSMMTVMDLDVVGFQAILYQTTYIPTSTGNHYISYGSMGPGTLSISNTSIINQPLQAKDSMSFLLGVAEEKRDRFYFRKGEKYEIMIETVLPEAQNSGLYILDGQVCIHFGLVEQEEMEQDIFNEAMAIAKEADYCLCFVGNNMQWETEGQDMLDYSLPADGSQDALIRGVVGINPNTIVINTTGVAVRVPWLNEVPALLQTWYGGQEAGNAVVDVLFGEVNPSGKLPISWPREYEDTACFGNFGMDSFETEEVEYVEGVYVGYRHFDRCWGTEKEVLFPFGFGLSYTEFKIEKAGLEIRMEEGELMEACVTVDVKNVGAVTGAESVQIYIMPPVDEVVERPVKSLAGFEKIFLSPGQQGTVQIRFGKDALAFWGVESSNWCVSKGVHRVVVAPSSSPVDVAATLELDIPERLLFGP